MIEDDDYHVFNTGQAEEGLPESIISLIDDLIKRDNVQSVSCPFNNREVWRLLVAEQMRRSKLLGKPLQQAFELSGPEGGLGFDPTEWGGKVHIPYEGACPADFFIAPEWRDFYCETNHSKLRTDYYYLLVQRDFGELKFAFRRIIGDGWLLYESTRPYVKANIFGMRFPPEIDISISRAAEAISNADSLVITAGAGMGVGSGLPDFRGKEGFWKAYPALAKAQIGFTEIACPETFESNPKLAWGFYGHRLNLYRNTEPHPGFRHLQNIAQQLDGGAFVFTSNVDGQFQKAGFPLNNIVECHGSIHHLQCQQPCNQEIWEATKFTPTIDEEHCLLTSSYPTCPNCGGIARPNILMFDDSGWVNWRTEFQRARFYEWRETVHHPVVIELGAGKSIPTVRQFGQSLNVPLIRINPTDFEVNRPSDISLKMGAAEGIFAILAKLMEMGFIENPLRH